MFADILGLSKATDDAVAAVDSLNTKTVQRLSYTHFLCSESTISCKWSKHKIPSKKIAANLHKWTTEGSTEEYAADSYVDNLTFAEIANAFEENELKSILQNSNQSWTLSETIELLILCDKYKTRFCIVHDRFPENINSRAKSLDDIQKRYFGVMRSLLSEYYKKVLKQNLSVKRDEILNHPTIKFDIKLRS
eukprot:GHVP01061408.1.p1 GENE.GHVP01061408.1~~GHVP01061408.1.p1  ORF type:complete len:192 (+),score=33.47 GHVP01061408.1:54-629(+)